jgi:tetratricopeptide (TPR) repeat protein
MRTIDAIRLVVVLVFLVGRPPVARTQSGQDAADLDRATEMFDKGDLPAALARVEAVLARSPTDETALYRSAFLNFQLNNADAARGRLERLVKLSGSYFAAWELMVQVAQYQGDLARRDDAIERVKIAIRTAIDPDIRLKTSFIRERIPVGDRAVMAVDYFARGGSDFTRYQFGFGDPREEPEKGLLLRTDAYTTENWADTALLPQDQQLFHLDLVDLKPEGGDKVAIYEYYVGEPSYDVVRAKVLQILRGEVQPLSGVSGSLQGILRK